MIYTHKFRIEYFVKDLHSDEQGGGYKVIYNTTFPLRCIESLLLTKKTAIATWRENIKFLKTAEEFENYLNVFYVPKNVAVNERMIKNGRKPLFKAHAT